MTLLAVAFSKRTEWVKFPGKYSLRSLIPSTFFHFNSMTLNTFGRRNAKLMEQSGLHPEELRNRVTSPNGTTQAALESFSADKLREIVRKAAHAARDRSIELSDA